MTAKPARITIQKMTTEASEIGLRGYRTADPARSMARHASILSAAARVFRDKGYYAATMDDIAQVLGVTKGVVYYHFRSKEEVLLEIQIKAISSALTRLVVTAESDAPPVERLFKAIHDLIRYNLIEDTSNYYAMMLVATIKALSEENRITVHGLSAQYQRTFVDIIQSGIDEGVFGVDDARMAAMTILTAANGVSNWFDPKGRLSADEVADEVSRQLVRGISLSATED